MHSTTLVVKMLVKIHTGISNEVDGRRLVRMGVKMMEGMRICLSGMILLRLIMVISLLPRRKEKCEMVIKNDNVCIFCLLKYVQNVEMQTMF